MTIAALGALAFAVPAVADQTTTTPSTPSAKDQCRSERSDMGKGTFAQTYGTNRKRSNAFGKCVSKRSKATQAAGRDARSNAAKECKAERTADPATFRTTYGTGKKGANAYGKCVSQKAKQQKADEVDAQQAADVSAAKDCRAERKADPAAFKDTYGTNGNKRNAFGKCVSQKTKAQPDEQPTA